jgi:hypothetical protein
VTTRRYLVVLWAASALAFTAFASMSVRRLTNYNAGDIDLAGWTGFVAARLTRGERPYVDFVTPLGPASLLVRSLVERASGALRLIDELALVACCRFAMAALSYAIAVTVASRTTASLVAIATLALLLGSSRDNAFEVLGQLGLWASLACAARAWQAPLPSRKHWWLATGACSALTLGFDARCAAAGTMAWIALLGISTFRSQERRADFGAWARGMAMGFGLVLVEVLLCRSTPRAFAEAVLNDGLTFTGGVLPLAWTPLRSLFGREAYSSSLLLTAATVVLGAKLLLPGTSQQEPKNADLEPGARERRVLLGAAVLVVAALGTATILLSNGTRGLPKQLLAVSLNAGAIVGAGIVLGCFHTVWHARSGFARAPDETRVLRLLFGFALLAALFREPWYFGIHPEYGGDVLTAVALIFVFLAAESAKRSFVAPLVLALSLIGLFGLKLHRALEASTLVRTGYWANLYVNHRGSELLAAAQRARELTPPEATLLVLPEDPQIAALIGRPRPRLRGALVFSNHYPARLLEDDRRELEQRPPRAVVVHPRRAEQWQPWLLAFSPHPAAAALSLYVSSNLLPGRYRLDASYRTTYVTDQGALDVWVLDDQKPSARSGVP